MARSDISKRRWFGQHVDIVVISAAGCMGALVILIGALSQGATTGETTRAVRVGQAQNVQVASQFTGQSTLVKDVPDSVFSWSGITFSDPVVPSGSALMSSTAAIAEVSGGSPTLIQQAQLKHVVSSQLHIDCNCWVLSMTPGFTAPLINNVQHLPGEKSGVANTPTTPPKGTWGYILVDASSGQRVYSQTG